MEAYRITKTAYAQKLSASGAPGRWNGQNEYVIYASESRALAALEMVAHRSYKMAKDDFKLLSISLPDASTFVTEIPIAQLPKGWKTMRAYNQLQRIGGNWYRSRRSLILKVPSVLIEEEYNLVINTDHPDFTNHAVLKDSRDFRWDHRLLYKVSL